MRRTLLYTTLTISIASGNLYAQHAEERVSLYKPNYFIFDTNWDAKFQLSYRIRLIPMPKLIPLPKSIALFVGHTHKAFWALNSQSSAPFEEHNFNPEAILDWQIHKQRYSIELENLQLSFEHESNGVAGTLSRSWNRLSGQIGVAIPPEKPGVDWHFHTQIRGWLIVNRDEDYNRDIDKHLGYGELNLSYAYHLPQKYGWQLATTLRSRSIMVDLAMKLPVTDFFLYAQYWSGRGEGLVNYKENTTFLRLGVKFAII